MKKVVSILLALMLALSLTFIIACNDNTDNNNSTPSSTSESTGSSVPDSTDSSVSASLWDNATYKENTEFGNGTTTIQVEIKAEDKSVTLTIKTDKTTLSEAMKEHNLIQGENGLYTVVNGMTADWNIDKTYWALSENGEYSMVGADTLEISDGGHYEWTKTK